MTTEEYILMLNKADCITVDQLIEESGKSKQTIYNYLNFLGIQRHRFPFDRRSYIVNADASKVLEAIKENKQ